MTQSILDKCMSVWYSAATGRPRRATKDNRRQRKGGTPVKKRALTLLPALVMCLSLCTPVLVSTPHYLETDWSEALSSGVPLSTVVELITEKYLLPQTEGLNSVTTNNGTAASDIVKLCRPVETQSIGGVACTKFQMDDFKDYYPECNQLRSISQLGNKFYVEYISRDGQELAFSYDANGLSDCCIYDPATDRALFFSRYEQIVYENFRNGEAVSSISNNTPQTADVQITKLFQAVEKKPEAFSTA